MKFRNRTRARRDQKLALEPLEERRMMTTTTLTDISKIDSGTLSPALEAAFNRVSDLTQYTATQLTESDWVVRLQPDGSTAEIADALKFSEAQFEATPLIENTFIIPSAGQDVSDTLASISGIEYFYPLVNEVRVTKLIPNDSFFDQQWNLLNVGQSGGLAGEDINVVNAWDNFTGDGITIAIVDDGVDSRHPDLAPNFNAALSFDFVDGDADASPLPDEEHGTVVAGIAAAAGNNDIGVAGVAFDADIAGIRLISGPGATDFEESEALSHELDAIDVYNNSWGPADAIDFFDAPGPFTLAALQANTSTGVGGGRNGLGAIYVFPAGNGGDLGDNANYDGYANSIFTIAVAAVDDQGQQPSYSESGANILVSAPGGEDGVGILSTDNVGNDGITPFSGTAGAEIADDDPSNFDSTFFGTSAAVPGVTGVIALMLDANPQLTYRDIQHILVRTSRMNDATDIGWNENGAGFPVNHAYGFGVVDAEAAVALANSWTNVTDEVTFITDDVQVDEEIPDNDPSGVSFVINVPEPADGEDDLNTFRVEHVQIQFNTDHTFRGDLEITLTSPDGTTSILAEPHLGDPGGLDDWLFDSVHHWGEGIVGDWTVRISDNFANDVATMASAQLIFSGTGEIGLPEDTTPELPPPPATNGLISGTIFADASGNGIQDNNEDPLSGITAFLDLNNNGLLDEGDSTSVTGSLGLYSFAGLNIGQTFQVGYVCNLSATGVNQATGLQSTTVGLSGRSLGVDFAAPAGCSPGDGGATTPGGAGTDQTVVSGTIFNDVDGDGERDLAENPIEGLLVYADLNNNCVIGLGEPAARTNADGTYSLAVSGGEHFIRVVPNPGTQITACAGQRVTVDGSLLTADIGFAGDDEFDFANNGSSEHGIYPGFGLGQFVSSDTDFNDDDGVFFTNGLTPGQTSEIVVIADKVAVSTAFLQGWIDWNGDGSFGSGEQVFRNVSLADGLNRLDITTPANAATNQSIRALFRYGFENGLNSTNPALSGEAEDYQITLPLAPDSGIIVRNDEFNIVENTGSQNFDVLANDFGGPFSSSLNITSIGTPNQGGTARIFAGNVLYTPDNSFDGVETFTYTAINSFGDTETGVVTVNIANAAFDDSFSVELNSEQTTLDVLANDFNSDPSDDDREFYIITSVGNANGTVSISPNGDLLLYQPRAGFSGIDQFTYTNVDQDGLTSSATVTVNVDLPSGAVDDTFTVQEDSAATALDVTLNDRPEIGAEPFTLVSTTTPDMGGIVLITNGILTYQPPVNFVGVDTFDYTVADALSNLFTATVRVNVTDVNDAPEAFDDQFEVQTDSQNNLLDVTGNDTTSGDANEIISLVSVGSGSNGGAIRVADDGLRVDYTPAAGFTGTEFFDYVITDGNGASVTSTATVFVVQNLTEDQAAYRFDVTDVNGNELTTVAVGEQFQVRVFVEDLTDVPDTPFSAYLDAYYDRTLVTLLQDTDDLVSIAFNEEVYPSAQSAVRNVSGIINELGAVDGISEDGNGDPVLLATLTFRADSVGTAVFDGNPADVLPLHETTLFGINQSIDPFAQGFFSDSVAITDGNAGGGVGGIVGARVTRRLDTNGDGNVSPIDALQILNHLNGVQTKSVRADDFDPVLDVNEDGSVSPVDALLVINYLNDPTGFEEDPDTKGDDPVAALSSSVSVDDFFADDEDDNDEDWIETLALDVNDDAV